MNPKAFVSRSLFLGLVLFVCGLFCGWTAADTMYVTVLDPSNGAALQKSDITLKVDKKDTPVIDFVAVDTTSRTPEVLRHRGGRRQYVLTYDLIFSKPEEIIQARKTTELLLSKANKDDLFAVAVLSQKTGLRLWSGLTNDRNKITNALNAIGLDKVPGMLLGPDGNLYVDPFTPSTNTVELIPEDQFLAHLQSAATVDEKKKGTKLEPANAFILEFSDLAYALAEVDGRKNIILFSPGFDTKGSKISMSEKGFADQYVDAAIAQPEYLGNVEEQRANEESARRQEREAAENAAPVIQADGVPEFVAGSFSTVHLIASTIQEYDFCKKLTADSGGLYLRNPEDMNAAIQQILDLDRKYYVIGFDGKTEKAFKDVHSIKVESAGRAITAPSVWVAPKSYSLFTPMEKKLHVSEAIYKNFDPPGPGEKFWADFSYQQGTSRVPLFAQIAGADILKQDLPEYAMEAYGFLQDSTGALIDFTTTPVRLDLKNKALRERVGKAGLKVWSILIGGKGPATVRWILVDSQFGDTTTNSQTLEMQDAELTTTYPFVPSSNFDWLVWPRPQDTQTKRGIALQYPYAIGQDLFFPDLTPAFKKGDKDQVVYFKIYNRLPESKNPPIELSLIDQSDKPVKIEQFALLQKPKELEQGGMELFWKLMALPDVPPGAYRLRVDIRDTLKKKEVIREIPMEIR